MISSEDLAKFKYLYKEKYNIDLTDEQTTELATHFLNLMEILIKPRPKSKEPFSEDVEDKKEDKITPIEKQDDLVAYLEGGCE